jgi:mycothiol synthase
LPTVAAALLTAIAAADQQDEHFSEQDLLAEFAALYLDFPRGSVAVYDGTTMAAYCVLTVRTTADPVHQMRQRAGVHPAYRGRGLGGQLLEWAEKAAVLLHHDRYPGRPLALRGGCSARNAEAIALFAAHGYQAVRWYHGTTRDLSAAIAGSRSASSSAMSTRRTPWPPGCVTSTSR